MKTTTEYRKKYEMLSIEDLMNLHDVSHEICSRIHDERRAAEIEMAGTIEEIAYRMFHGKYLKMGSQVFKINEIFNAGPCGDGGFYVYIQTEKFSVRPFTKWCTDGQIYVSDGTEVVDLCVGKDLKIKRDMNFNRNPISFVDGKDIEESLEKSKTMKGLLVDKDGRKVGRNSRVIFNNEDGDITVGHVRSFNADTKMFSVEYDGNDGKVMTELPSSGFIAK